MSKAEADIDEWIKDLAPSTELRKWFGHDPQKWKEFSQRYLKELSAPEKTALLQQVALAAEKADVTLIYSAKDTEHSDVKVLQELITRMLKKVPG